MITEYLRLKDKVKNHTASPEEYRRYLSLLAKIENEKEGTLRDFVKERKQRWI